MINYCNECDKPTYRGGFCKEHYNEYINLKKQNKELKDFILKIKAALDIYTNNETDIWKKIQLLKNQK